jgi:hypothetical protein
MMIDENTTRLRTHRKNMSRYRRLLKTPLTDLEREFLERRLVEEQSALEALASDDFAVTPNHRPELPTAAPKAAA